MSGHVLIVDDDADVRAMLGLALESQGYATALAADGVDALQRLRHDGEVALVLLDLRMPRMNGLEFLAALRADGARARIPVVVVTGDSGSARQAMQAGADGLLVKPIDLDAVMASVRRFVR